MPLDQSNFYWLLGQIQSRFPNDEKLWAQILLLCRAYEKKLFNLEEREDPSIKSKQEEFWSDSCWQEP